MLNQIQQVTLIVSEAKMSDRYNLKRCTSWDKLQKSWKHRALKTFQSNLQPPLTSARLSVFLLMMDTLVLTFQNRSQQRALVSKFSTNQQKQEVWVCDQIRSDLRMFCKLALREWLIVKAWNESFGRNQIWDSEVTDGIVQERRCICSLTINTCWAVA